MKYLNYKQLGFVLGISPIKALEKIIAIHCGLQDKEIPGRCEKVGEYLFDIVVRDGKKIKFRNDLPELMDIETLSEKLNLPTLQASVDDICTNYLKRPGSRKWILCDYPEKQLATKDRHEVKIPPVLRSMLPSEQISEIKDIWRQRFKIPVK